VRGKGRGRGRRWDTFHLTLTPGHKPNGPAPGASPGPGAAIKTGAGTGAGTRVLPRGTSLKEEGRRGQGRYKSIGESGRTQMLIW